MARKNPTALTPNAEQWQAKLRAECLARIRKEREKQIWKKRSPASADAARQTASDILQDVSRQLQGSFASDAGEKAGWQNPVAKDAARLSEKDYVDLMQHLEQSLMDESAQEEADELQRLEEAEVEDIINSMLDDTGSLSLRLDDGEHKQATEARRDTLQGSISRVDHPG